MEMGKYGQLQREMKEMICKLYQNQPGEVYLWIGGHIQEIKDSLLEQMSYYRENDKADIKMQEWALTILEHLIYTYQNHLVIELADSLNYEYSRYMGWEI